MSKRIRGWLLLLPQLATVVTAVYVLFLSRRTAPDLEEIAKWIVVILALMAISGIVERAFQVNRIQKDSEQSAELLRHWFATTTDAPFLKTYDDLPPLPERLEGAKTIWISGRALNSLLGAYGGLLRKMAVEEKSKIRILIVDSGGSIPKAEQQTHQGDKSLENFSARAKASEAEISTLCKSLGKKSENVEVKILDYAPRLGILITDPDKQKGIVQVQILLHYKGSAERPIFRLSADKDIAWFNVFVEQYKQLWNAAKPFEN